jgi:predicted O-methyltransferase YrrM
MKKANRHTTPQDIRELAIGFRHTRILLTALELDVFTVLGDREKSSRQVAEEAGTDPRGTDRLLNALVTLGFLIKENDRFINTPAARRYLNQRSPDFMRGLLHTANQWRTWTTLTEAVRAGGQVLAPAGDRETTDRTRAFIGAMHARARDQAGMLSKHLDLSGVRRILDVGGGSGVYTMAMVRGNPERTAVIFDLPRVIPLTRQYIQEEGLAAQVSTVEGNYLNDDLGSGFDLVFMSAIIHINSPQENRQLIQKGANALNPGGRLVILDFIVDHDRTGPEQAVIFALNMLVGTPGGDTYTEAEIRAWMEAAGLSEIIRKDPAPDLNLLLGKK